MGYPEEHRRAGDAPRFVDRTGDWFGAPADEIAHALHVDIDDIASRESVRTVSTVRRHIEAPLLREQYLNKSTSLREYQYKTLRD